MVCIGWPCGRSFLACSVAGEEDVAGITGSKVAVHLRDAINAKPELEGFGDIEEVHFTSFVMQ